jgi:hypothetical protein
MANENCLEGIKCPDCGNEDEFRIEAVIVCQVTDDGSEPIGDHYWDEKSYCHCPVCEKDGKLAEFINDEIAEAA